MGWENPAAGEKAVLLASKDDEFTPIEKRNIKFFIAGLMCFKFAFESLNGSIALFVKERITTNTNTTLAVLLISYGFAQSLGSMLVSQLIRIFRANRVIATAMATFACVCSAYILLEFFSGGTIHTDGKFDPYLVFPLYISMGGCLGVMELIRRVIPSFIVGTNPEKLKKMDATVHIFYEVAGTSGAFAGAPIIGALGPVYATVSIPPLFFLGAVFYSLVNHKPPVKPVETDYTKRHIAPIRFLLAIKEGLINYGMTVYIGAAIVFKNRHFAWLIMGYVIPLVLHRTIESFLFPLYANDILHDGSLSQILLGGSNFGELCGAALVLKFSHHIRTPIPWVRVDALALCVLWVFYKVHSVDALILALSFVPVMMVLSGAWAAGDVSLLAYIQSQLPEEDDEETSGTISPIGAVMGFLYASYVIISALLQYGLGVLFDNIPPETGFFWVAGVGMSGFSVLIFASTFIPKGSWSFNPTAEEMQCTTIIKTYSSTYKKSAMDTQRLLPQDNTPSSPPLSPSSSPGEGAGV